MDDSELVTAADVQLMQGLAQRVTAVRPDPVNSGASLGEPAWVWGKGHASEGESWLRRPWFSGDVLVAWGWACLPHRVRRSDGSVKDVTSPSLAYHAHPDHSELVEEVIDRYDGATVGIERTVVPSTADEFALERWVAHGYETDPAGLGDTGSWTQFNQRDLEGVERPVLPTDSDSAPLTRPGCRPRSRLTWWRHRTERWRHRRSCGSTRRTGPPNSSWPEHIPTTDGSGWAGRRCCTRCIWRRRPGPGT
ncbi:hypothetical protein O1G22_02400 [Streptomyces camelliae]|uniref:Uncharacterized protein n=1 Tax=Streptomyces camelliae TaxID=3004093 RepID=A0ABY7PKN0_9ACTN|nr:hypothetical protein [Streptomyces sp. HUAS 2-6]WBO69513.1 hypothetical protein O1G22_02400 [Streptomyces sp. HUAS 2-6]